MSRAPSANRSPGRAGARARALKGGGAAWGASPPGARRVASGAPRPRLWPIAAAGTGGGEGGFQEAEFRAEVAAVLAEAEAGVGGVGEGRGGWADWGEVGPSGSPTGPAEQRERCILVGIYTKVSPREAYLKSLGPSAGPEHSPAESLEELGRLAESAGLEVVDTTTQFLETPNVTSYMGRGKLAEVNSLARAFDADTVIVDGELSPRQLRNLDAALHAGVCDRTNLILDIFSQRAATREGALQVELAQMEYQLPRLTRMWTHLERQAGGMVKGMGEKQIEIDKRILRKQISQVKKEIEKVRRRRGNARRRRIVREVPVVALVGYTNTGKSTLLNSLCGAGVLEADQLFATLDPTTRRVGLPSGKEALFSDTVGFIQKLPTMLVAAFRATLEETASASLLLHVVDVSHPAAVAQAKVVERTLQEIGAADVPLITVWNKIDSCNDPEEVRRVAQGLRNTVCTSGSTGEGLDGLRALVEEKLQELTMQPVHVLLPYEEGQLLDELHRSGVVEAEAYEEAGVRLAAAAPASLAGRLEPFSVPAPAPPPPPPPPSAA